LAGDPERGDWFDRLLIAMLALGMIVLSALLALAVFW
jgi:hypothetical protein